LPASSLGEVAGLIGTEAGIGAAYDAAAFALFRLFELEEHRSAALETY
jgi:hypothetical protein